MTKHFLRAGAIWLVLVCYWLALFVATHVPQEVIAAVSNVPDKVPHFIGYAGLALLLAAAWRAARGEFTFRHFCLAWLLVVIYGVIDEWTQIPVGRDASVWDWLADGLGAATGLAVFLAWNRWRQHASAPESAPQLDVR